MGWQTHVDSITSRISKGLFMLRVLKSNISIESLITVYYGHVHSHINYGIIFWGNHVSSHRVFILQKRAIRIIYGVSNRTHCKPLFIKSGILTVPSMYVLACLLHVKQNVDNLPIVSSIHGHSTRNNSNVYISKCKYSSTQNSFQ